MKKKICVVSVSSSDIKDSLLHKSTISCNSSKFEFQGKSHNKDPLSSLYNKFISEQYRDYIVVFVHDDVYIADGDFVIKCHDAIEKYDVFGVAGGAGSISIEQNKPCLWHLISSEKVGFAGHFSDTEEIIKHKPYLTTSWVTTFGTSPNKATLIDGVFFGVNVEKVLDAGIKFDEECPARFHFYDLLFCVKAKKKGLSLGVFPFNIFHASHGLKEVTEEFKQGDLYFRNFCANLN